MWSDDNDSRFPWTVAIAAGGTKTVVDAWRHFAVISNEIVTPKVLHCPSDTDKNIARDFAGTPDSFLIQQNNALSFAIGTESTDLKANMHVVTDRNLSGLGGQYCQPADVQGVTTLDPRKDNPHWEYSIHYSAGDMAMGDGSVQQVTQGGLLQYLQTSGDTNFSNCVLKP